MDYEKAYKEAIQRARKCLDEKRDTCFVRPDVIFPELAESEDEKIRKAIIAWLEKQREQKSLWTEEDESKVEDIIYFLDTAKTHYASTKALDDCIEWLKSLKQRMKEK